MNEIFTPETIGTILGLLLTAITGLFAKEKVTTTEYKKYTDPDDPYNKPPKGISEGAVKVVSQDDYGKVPNSVSGRISSEGRVIGEASIELYQRDVKGIEYQKVPFTEVKQDDVTIKIAMKTSPIVTGDIVYGYSLDGKDIKVVGQNTLATTSNAPKSEWLYFRFSQYSTDFTVGEHKVTIYQGYVDGKTPIGGDNVVWWKHNDFLVDVI